MTQAGKLLVKAGMLCGRMRRRFTTAPASSSPTRLQLFLPRSIPKTDILIAINLPPGARQQPTPPELRGGPFHKLCRACRRDHGNACPKDAGRSVVSGRNAARPEKPAHPALGAARYQATGARRFAYQIGLSVWCDLSQTRRGGGGSHAERQYADDAASP